MSDLTGDQAALCEELDRKLLALVRKDKPTAAVLNVARQRLRDLGANRAPGLDESGDDGIPKQLAEELGLNPKTLRMPDLDERADAATA